MKILHVAAPAIVGGLEQVVADLATSQHQDGHDVRVAAILQQTHADGPHTFLDQVRRGGVTVEVIALPSRAYLHERARLSSLLDGTSPDVVHTHGYRCDVLASGLAQSAGAALVTTVHGFTGGGWKIQIYERLQRRFLRKFDSVVAVSAPLAASLVSAGVDRERIHVVPNAWIARPILERDQARERLGLHGETLRIGWVGRLSEEKGPDLMLRAIALLPDLDFTLSFLGDGPERTRLRSLANSLGVDQKVSWFGNVPDAGSLIRAFDLVVLSSRTEGTPIVLLEAMAAEVPVVATRVGGIPDVVSDSEALVVPPNDPAALAGAIRSTFVAPQAALERASVAHSRLMNAFSERAWRDGYERAYASALEKPSRRKVA